MVSFLNAVVKTSKKAILLGHRVSKIDSTGDVVKVHVGSKVFLAKKVISSIPLGVLKAGTVTFQPALSQDHAEAIRKIGFGVVDKLFVKLEKPFWKEGVKWVNFITKNLDQNYFPNAYVVPKAKSHVVVFYVPGDFSLELSRLSKTLLKSKLEGYLKKFPTLEEVSVLDLELTKWHADPNALGSYSYYRVGCTDEHFDSLAAPISNKVWMVGEHTSPEHNYFLQGAYNSGEKAAKEVAQSLVKQSIV